MPFPGHAVGYVHSHRATDPMRYIDLHYGKWRVRIPWRGSQVYLGRFAYLVDAKVARDAWLVRHKRQVRFVRRVPK